MNWEKTTDTNWMCVVANMACHLNISANDYWTLNIYDTDAQKVPFSGLSQVFETDIENSDINEAKQIAETLIVKHITHCIEICKNKIKRHEIHIEQFADAINKYEKDTQ